MYLTNGNYLLYLVLSLHSSDIEYGWNLTRWDNFFKAVYGIYFLVYILNVVTVSLVLTFKPETFSIMEVLLSATILVSLEKRERVKYLSFPPSSPLLSFPLLFSPLQSKSKLIEASIARGRRCAALRARWAGHAHVLRLSHARRNI